MAATLNIFAIEPPVSRNHQKLQDIQKILPGICGTFVPRSRANP
jgi:hypothetical protein